MEHNVNVRITCNLERKKMKKCKKKDDKKK